MDLSNWIDKKVRKISGKPFKSSLKENTVKEIVVHEILSSKKGFTIYAFSFYEDDSYVLCSSCELVLK